MLYTLAGLPACFVADVYQLIVLRLLQALGGCAGMVIGRAIVRDTTLPQEAARRLATMNLMVVLGLGLAPLLGGALTAAFGWRSIFYVLSLLGVFDVLFALWLLPESHAPTSGVRAAGLTRNYGKLLTSPVFLGVSVGGGCTTPGHRWARREAGRRPTHRDRHAARAGRARTPHPQLQGSGFRHQRSGRRRLDRQRQWRVLRRVGLGVAAAPSTRCAGAPSFRLRAGREPRGPGDRRTPYRTTSKSCAIGAHVASSNAQIPNGRPSSLEMPVAPAVSATSWLTTTATFAPLASKAVQQKTHRTRWGH